ncbi:MAG: 50S ribosomal protein L9 [Acidimicrobiia bacterium]|jgi:large subunit ribosomal protein L9
MATEVILRQYVEHLGNRGDVVKVADGYARNYLLPRGMALRVNDEARRQIEREREKAEARETDERKSAEALAAALGALDLSIARRVGEHDTLYGSVTTTDIGEALAARQLVVDRRRIQLADPIKTLGEHPVNIRIHRDVTATVIVKVVPTQQAGGQTPVAPAETTEPADADAE